MKLRRLILENFRSHESTNIDFTTLGSPVLIRGVNKDRGEEGYSNGSGKSSIFDAIDYALFHRAGEILRFGSQRGRVVLEFEHHTFIYEIEKTFTAAEYTVKLSKNGAIVSEQKSEVEKCLREILGMSRKIFEQTVYQSQGFGKFFSVLPASMKSQYVMELLDIEKWEDYHVVAKEIIKVVIAAQERIQVKKEMLESQIVINQTTLAQADEVGVKKSLEAKQTALDGKKALLQSYQQTEMLTQQRADLAARERTLLGLRSAANDKINAAKGARDTNKIVQAELASRAIVPVDTNYKTTLSTNALSMEKGVAAKEQEMRSLAKQIEDFDKKRPVIMLQTVCPFCRQTMGPEYKTQLTQHLDGERAAMMADYSTLSGEFTNLQGMRDGLAGQLEAVNRQILVYNEHVKNLDDVTRKIADAENLVTIWEPQKQNYEAELAQLGGQIRSIDAILSAADLSQVGVLKADIITFEKAVGDLQAKLRGIEELRGRIWQDEAYRQELLTDLTRYGEAQDLLRHTVNAFSINGIQKWLFINALDEISAMTNSLLRDAGFSIVFQLEKTKKSGEGFKPVFEIMTLKHSDNRMYLLEDLSGGERSLINFALRLAFTTIVATASDYKFMIIDEGFVDLDASYREYIAGVTKRLAQQFQICLVTHFPDLESEFDNIMTVEKSGGISRIRID